jgi:NAD(P)-dependent dehydrogenase (short-subunit alcohol dehydrogenase family)
MSTDPSQRLAGKVAIVTGATGGIGEATAALFLSEGAKVMLVGRSAAKLAATADRLAGADRVARSEADAGDEAATAAAVAATAAAFGGVDILFANAGTEGVIKTLDQHSQAEFEAVLRTNLTGVWAAMKHCVAPMKARGGGSMIANASMLGMVGFAGGAPYVASKHAVCGLVKSAALELGGFGIRVNAIAPGFIDNRMMQSLADQAAPDNPDAVRDGLAAQVALRRYGTNEEVARLALYLASGEASYTTGAVHAIDGGFTAA